MIAILKEEDIDLIVKSYMYSDNTNYILRLIKVFSKESERYCLFSFDYMSDQAKNYSLISYKDKKCTCTCCNHSVQDSMLYLLEDNLITICFDCLQRKHFSFSPDVNISFVAKLLAKHNHVEILTKIFSSWDTEHSYYGYRVRNVSGNEEVFYYLDTQDRYSLHNIDKNRPFNVTFNNARLLFLYNYYFLMKLLKQVSDKEICYKVLSKNFSQEELQEAKLTLASFSQATVVGKTNDTGKASESFSQEQRQQRQPLRAAGELGAKRPSCLTEGAKRRRESNNSQEITAIKSKSDNCLMVGQTYKNAKIKLQKIKKDKRGFFKGHYKHLYAIYYGNHSLLWNTNKDVEDGKYICTFTVQRSALTWGYMFINNCRLKKIEKE